MFKHHSAQKKPDTPQNSQVQQGEAPTGQGDKSPEKPDQPEQPQFVWGVDSATKVDQAFFSCVADNYGKPVVFGRYLETKEGVFSGLTIEEAAFLHEQGVKIIPIFNHFTNATTYEHGVAEAKEAIASAQKLGIPDGIAVFADIEPSYPVDEAFIRGWVETLLQSPYKPGIYGVFTNDSKLAAAYQAASTNNENAISQTIIWSSNPDPGVTTQGEAPKFQPDAPENVNVSIWQYGINGKACNIDTNLIQSEILDNLW